MWAVLSWESCGAEPWNSVTKSVIQPVTSMTPLTNPRMHSPPPRGKGTWFLPQDWEKSCLYNVFHKLRGTVFISSCSPRISAKPDAWQTTYTFLNECDTCSPGKFVSAAGRGSLSYPDHRGSETKQSFPCGLALKQQMIIVPSPPSFRSEYFHDFWFPDPWKRKNAVLTAANLENKYWNLILSKMWRETKRSVGSFFPIPIK